MYNYNFENFGGCVVNQ